MTNEKYHSLKLALMGNFPPYWLYGNFTRPEEGGRISYTFTTDNTVNRNLKTQKQLVNNQRWRAFKFKTADCLSVLVSIKKKEALLYIFVKT